MGGNIPNPLCESCWEEHCLDNGIEMHIPVVTRRAS
jgi:hypothetical protein